jgi:hypothetical protein
MRKKASLPEVAAFIVLMFGGLVGATICIDAFYEGRQVTAGSTAMATLCVPALILGLRSFRTWNTLDRLSIACALAGAVILACVGAGVIPDSELPVYAGFGLLIVPLCAVGTVSLRADLARLRADD